MESQRNADRSGLSVCPSLSINQHATTYRKIGEKKQNKNKNKPKTQPALNLQGEKDEEKEKESVGSFSLFLLFPEFCDG